MDNSQRSELMEIYKEAEHRGELKDASMTIKEENMFCGDELQLFLKIEKEKVVDAKFTGSLCFISSIASELLLEDIIGKNFKDLKKINKEYLLKKINLNLSTSRIACATLILEALKKAIRKHEKENI